MRVRCGAQCIWVKAVNLVASYRRGICAPWGAFLEWRTAQQIGRWLESAVRSPCSFSGSVLPSGSLIACLIPTVRLYVVCWRQICILLLLIVLAGLLKSRMRSMDCKEVQCSNRKCWEPHRFPCNSSFAICVSDIWRYGGKLIFSCPRAVNKKAVTFHKWCGSSESGPRGSPFSIPSYMYKDLDKHVLRNFSKFRLRAHQCFFFRDIDVFRRWTYPFWRWAKTLSEHLGLQGTPRQNHLWALRGPSEGRNLAWNQKSFSFKLLKWAMRMRANGQKKSEWWSILERVYGRTCPMQPASYEVWQRA